MRKISEEMPFRKLNETPGFVYFPRFFHEMLFYDYV